MAFTHGKIKNMYIVYKIRFSTRGYDDYPVLKKVLYLVELN